MSRTSPPRMAARQHRYPSTAVTSSNRRISDTQSATRPMVPATREAWAAFPSGTLLTLLGLLSELNPGSTTGRSLHGSDGSPPWAGGPAVAQGLPPQPPACWRHRSHSGCTGLGTQPFLQTQGWREAGTCQELTRSPCTGLPPLPVTQPPFWGLVSYSPHGEPPPVHGSLTCVVAPWGSRVGDYLGAASTGQVQPTTLAWATRSGSCSLWCLVPSGGGSGTNHTRLTGQWRGGCGRRTAAGP